MMSSLILVHYGALLYCSLTDAPAQVRLHPSQSHCSEGLLPADAYFSPFYCSILKLFIRTFSRDFWFSFKKLSKKYTKNNFVTVMRENVICYLHPCTSQPYCCEHVECSLFKNNCTVTAVCFCSHWICSDKD